MGVSSISNICRDFISKGLQEFKDKKLAFGSGNKEVL